MKGPIVKRYIYAGLGALGLAGAGVAVAMTLNPPSDLATAVVEPTYTVSASPSASPTDATGASEAPASPDATTTPSEEPKPVEEPVANTPQAPVDPDSTEPISSNDPLVSQKQNPGNEPELAPSLVAKTRADGSTYFVDAKTGQEVQQPQGAPPTNPAPAPNQAGPKPVDAVGAGSMEDKTNAATSYMNHLNALYNKNWDEACKYMILPAGVSAADCAARLEKRTNASPLPSEYSLNNVNTVDIQGDRGTVSMLALKNKNGEGSRAIPVTRSAADKNLWLISGDSLTEVK